ncbi:hypothetical protein ABZ136_32980, partial [Streptomyces microflavus]|uniref:hypothetical protein n=1 Tax=Streptomyces microflavus TaxID=1919 RepID=UPI0033BA2B42
TPSPTCVRSSNDNRADRIRPTIMEMFREQARTRPDAVAIIDAEPLPVGRSRHQADADEAGFSEGSSAHSAR